MDSQYKVYLGDGAYADFDGFQILLTTENGIETTNTVALESSVLRHFEHYVAELRADLKKKGFTL